MRGELGSVGAWCSILKECVRTAEEWGGICGWTNPPLGGVKS